MEKYEASKIVVGVVLDRQEKVQGDLTQTLRVCVDGFDVLVFKITASTELQGYDDYHNGHHVPTLEVKKL